MTTVGIPRRARMILPDGEIPLRVVYRGLRWSWRGFQFSGGVWRRRRWGWWPVFRAASWTLDVPEGQVDRVRWCGLGAVAVAVAVDVPGGSRLDIGFPC